MLWLTLVANVAVQQKQVRDMPMNLPQESFSWVDYLQWDDGL